MLPVITPDVPSWARTAQAEADACGEPVLLVHAVPSPVHGDPSSTYVVRESSATDRERRAAVARLEPSGKERTDAGQ